MTKDRGQGKRLFVIDTNVLMHDPTSIFRFEEHDIYIPMEVLEELDNKYWDLASPTLLGPLEVSCNLVTKEVTMTKE